MTSTRSKIVSVAPKVAASVHAQTWTSNVSAKIVIAPWPIKAQSNGKIAILIVSQRWLTSRIVHCTEIFEQRRAHERLE